MRSAEQPSGRTRGLKRASEIRAETCPTRKTRSQIHRDRVGDARVASVAPWAAPSSYSGRERSASWARGLLIALLAGLLVQRPRKKEPSGTWDVSGRTRDPSAFARKRRGSFVPQRCSGKGRLSSPRSRHRGEEGGRGDGGAAFASCKGGAGKRRSPLPIVLGSNLERTEGRRETLEGAGGVVLCSSGVSRTSPFSHKRE